MDKKTEFMSNIIEGNKDNVKELVEQEGIVIVDFWAQWCGPCRTLGPVLDNIAKEMPEIQIVKVNVDNNIELATEFGVKGIPAVFIYKDGQQINKFVGMKSQGEIVSLTL